VIPVTVPMITYRALLREALARNVTVQQLLVLGLDEYLKRTGIGPRLLTEDGGS